MVWRVFGSAPEMSVVVAITGSAVPVRENCNSPAGLAQLPTIARLCISVPYRSGSRLAPPAGERPGRDHRNLGPSAGSSFSLRARPCRQAGGRARVSAYLVNLPHPNRSFAVISRSRGGLATWGQSLTGIEQC